MKKVIFCHCEYSGVMPEDTKWDVLTGLRSARVDFTAMTDLCEMAAKQDPALKELAGSPNTTIIACYPRAVHWLLHAGGAGVEQDAVRVLNMRTMSAESILEQLVDAPRVSRGHAAEPIVGEKGSWVPWFPVIDYSRCENCKQCLSFCLFGVFALSEEGMVTVKNPSGCKNNCPACARICPEVAIVFPKLGEVPLNGAEIEDEEAARANIKVNIDRLLGDDIHAALEERRKKAKKRLLRKRAMEQAEKERAAFVANGSVSPGRETPP